MDTAELVWSWGTGRTGALAAGSCRGGLLSGGGLREVDDAAEASAVFPAPAPAAAATETFIPRAASCRNAQTPGLDLSLASEHHTRRDIRDPPKLSFLSHGLLSSSSLIAP